MDDLISRQAATDAINRIECTRYTTWYEFYQKVITAVGELPPAQLAPSQVATDIARIVENGQDMRVIGQHIRGHWIPVGGALYQCDQCGAVSLKRKFCSDCGAEMEREVTT